MSKCLHCNKPLRVIGGNRKNGIVINNSTGNDWNDREYHKKCFKEIKQQDATEFYLNNKNLFQQL